MISRMIGFGRQGIFALAATALAAAVTPLAATAASLTIDTFTSPSSPLQLTATSLNTVSTTTDPAADAIGGKRTIALHTDGIANGATDEASAQVAGGVLQYQNTENFISDLTITWDSLGGVDLTGGGGLDTFMITFASVNIGGNLTLELLDTNGFGASGSDVFFLPGSVSIGFGDLTTAAGFDLASVSQIALSLTGPANYDALIDSAEVVGPGLATAPLPASGLLLFAAFGGLGTVARRRRRAA